jgi:hypothetical protein
MTVTLCSGRWVPAYAGTTPVFPVASQRNP